MQQLPATLPQLLLRWYDNNRRRLPWREDPSPYRTWISEVMLQQTRVEAGIAYFERFTDALPDIAALAAVEEQQLLKLWEGLGYYSRARNLKKAAGILMEQYSGQLPADFEALKSCRDWGNTPPAPSHPSPLISECPPWTATCCGWPPACWTMTAISRTLPLSGNSARRYGRSCPNSGSAILISR